MNKISTLVVMRARNEPLYAYGPDFEEVVELRRSLVDGLAYSGDETNVTRIRNNILTRISTNVMEKPDTCLGTSYDPVQGAAALIAFKAASGEVYTVHAGSPEHIERIRLGLFKD